MEKARTHTGRTIKYHMRMVTMAKSLRLALAVGAEPTIGLGNQASADARGREGAVAPFQFPGKQKNAAGFHAGRILLLWHSSPE